MMHVRGRFIAVGIAVALSAGCGGGPASVAVDQFEVPTWQWGGDEGNSALVSGRLAFTDDGCTLLFSEDDDALPEPVVFPNAVGVRFGNGVRAVTDADSGKVFAIEGQEFSYAGGWVRPGIEWTEPCGAYEPDDIAYVNDHPAVEMPSEDPQPYAGTLPTDVPSLAERGWYEVPTFEWDPAQGGDDALLEGAVSMTEDGCAVVENSGGRTGLILPNAWGTTDAAYTGSRAIFSWFPESAGIMAEEGMEVSFGGGFRDVTDQWQELCPNSPVDDLFQAYDESPWG